MAEQNRANQYRGDSYIYDAGLDSDYEEDSDYGHHRNMREDTRSNSATTLGDIVDLSTFSDGEVSLALSMLTEHELDRLDQLVDDEQADADNFMIMVLEKQKHQNHDKTYEENRENYEKPFGMNRYRQDSVIRQKRSLFAPEAGGTLDDSFPHPREETASFHDSMEPLVRVKRGPAGV
ncbi:hypothetical protein RP20_CCG005841 [Aedes albopictus]|nr:hypothetical protein RP20_CCG005841 [Aedes albopictus]